MIGWLCVGPGPAGQRIFDREADVLPSASLGSRALTSHDKRATLSTERQRMLLKNDTTTHGSAAHSNCRHEDPAAERAGRPHPDHTSGLTEHVGLAFTCSRLSR